MFPPYQQHNLLALYRSCLHLEPYLGRHLQLPWHSRSRRLGATNLPKPGKKGARPLSDSSKL